MAVMGFQVTVTTSGTIQQVSKSTSPALPSFNINGVSAGSGSVTQHIRQIIFQANPLNTGTVSIGGAALVAATGVNLMFTLAPGAFSPPIGGGDLAPGTLDDFWCDAATSGNKFSIIVVD